jgi:hypothetical protein
MINMQRKLTHLFNLFTHEHIERRTPLVGLTVLFAVSNPGKGSATIVPQNISNPVQTRSVTSSDGVRIVYDVRGLLHLHDDIGGQPVVGRIPRE